MQRIYAVFFISLVLCLGFGFLVPNSKPLASEVSYWNELKYETWIEYPDGWFYTLAQIHEKYLIEYEQGIRLANSIRLQNGKYFTACNSEKIFVPEKFIASSLSIIQEMLNRGWANYLFRLDAFHGHLFVSQERFSEKYENLTTKEMIEEFVHDKTLGVLFHNAEHLALRNPPATGPIDPQAKEIIKNKNVLGWFEGKPLQIVKIAENVLLTNRKSFTAEIPKGYRSVGVITFKAHRNGEFSIQHENREIRLDLSPYECFYH